MYKNATVSMYPPVNAPNDEGTPISTYGYLKTPVGLPAETIRADVQPHRLSEAERALWGLSDKTADVRIMFYEKASYVKFGSRAKVVSDFDGSTKYFEIKPINLWPNHGEVLLVPVQGE